MEFVGAEVLPEVKEKVRVRAASKGVSQAELIRDILDGYFTFSPVHKGHMNAERALNE